MPIRPSDNNHFLKEQQHHEHRPEGSQQKTLLGRIYRVISIIFFPIILTELAGTALSRLATWLNHRQASSLEGRITNRSPSQLEEPLLPQQPQTDESAANLALRTSFSTAHPPLESLPPELMHLLISHLDRQDLQHAAALNRSLNTTITDDVVHTTCSSLKNFIRNLNNNLELARASSAQIKSINTVLEDISSTLSAKESDFTFKSLKAYLLKVQEKLISVIKTLHPKTIERLQASCQIPVNMENIFKLALIEIQIEAANSRDAWRGSEFSDRTFTEYKDIMLSKVSKDLARAKQWSRALGIAVSISDRNQTCYDISQICVSLGNTTKAIEFANMISPITNRLRSDSFSRICQDLIQKGELDQAIELANSMTEVRLKNTYLVQIAYRLLSLNQVDRAFALSQSISNFKNLDRCKNDICKALLKQDKIDQAVQLADAMSLDDFKTKALKEIISVLKTRGLLEEARVIAQKIPIIAEREKALKTL